MKKQPKGLKELEVGDFIVCDKLSTSDKIDFKLVLGLAAVLIMVVVYMGMLNNKLDEIGMKSYKTPSGEFQPEQTGPTKTPIIIDWKGDNVQ